jgi:predicted nucleic acid-binding protein
MAQRTKRLGTQSGRLEAYVDTAAFIAFLDKSDSHHLLFKRLFVSPPPLVTSALVIAEGHGWFLRRYDRYRATEFLAFVDALPRLKIQPLDRSDILNARKILARFGDQDLTLADAHGLSIMSARKCNACWSTDHRMGLAGAHLCTKGLLH